MIKLKKLLKGALVLGLVTCAGVFTGCSIFKEESTSTTTEVTTPEDSGGNSGENTPAKAFYIDQTYSALIKEDSGVQPVSVSATATTTGESTTNSRYLDYEKDVVSIKLKENGTAYLIKDLVVYTGAYSVVETNDETTINLIVADIDDNVCRLSVKVTEDEAVISESSNTDLFDNEKVTLKAVEDELFDNGLYVGINYESGGFTLKISDDEIYSSDGVESAGKIVVERVGNNLIYIGGYETNLFFVEKKGEHTEEFVEEFGDLEYVIYFVEDEGGRNNRYYDRKANADDVTLKITEKTTFTTTKLFTEVWDDGMLEESYENVNMQLTLNTNNTVDFKVTGNEKYNVTTTGKWYNIAGRLKSCQGVLVVLNDKSFFDGYFSLGTYIEDDEVGVTLADFKFYASSAMGEVGGIRYNIYWTPEAEKEQLYYMDESYIDKIYTHSMSWNTPIEIALKLKEDGTVYFMYNEEFYTGTYQDNEGIITLTLNNGEYILKIDKAFFVYNDESSPNDLLDDESNWGKYLNKKYYTDITIDNGLYVSVDSDASTEPGAYIRKISDNDIYGKDNVMEASKFEIVDQLAEWLIVKYNKDRAGEDYDFELWGIERKGEHTEEFVEEYGDLDYVIYNLEKEASGNNRYYYRKATANDITLKVTEKTTFTATKLFKHESGFDNALGMYVYNYSYEDVNMQLTINTNNTVKLVITGNEKYNLTTTGKWYNIGCGTAQGLLIILEDKTLFNGYFTIGVDDDDNITLEHLLTDDAYSSIDTDENTIYEIGWIPTTENDLKTEYDAYNS